jgi:hypothetical protein
LRVHNEGSITARFPGIQYVWTHKVKHPRFLRRQGFRFLEKVNFMKVPPIRPETRSSLLARYESDLQKLKMLTGIVF